MCLCFNLEELHVHSVSLTFPITPSGDGDYYMFTNLIILLFLICLHELTLRAPPSSAFFQQSMLSSESVIVSHSFEQEQTYQLQQMK